MRTSVLWFRRDLRLADHPALQAALDGSDAVVPLFVLDPTLLEPAGAPRVAFLMGCLRELAERIEGALVIRSGDPVAVVPRVAAEVDAEVVHVTADTGPYGSGRDAAVGAALERDGRELQATGTAYVVPPGSLMTRSGTPFKVFTPYYRAWKPAVASVGPPAEEPDDPRWRHGVDGLAVPAPPALGETSILEPGEEAGRRRLDAFLGDRVDRYGDAREVPGADGTSRLSVYLKYGCLHSRQVLARLGRGAGAETFRSELAWRDFYAGILAERPETAREPMRADVGRIRTDEGPDADERFDAWARGCTGYPIVDAGMRQLLAEAWMHNRVRMITASFLVKDLHVDWRRGARHFMRHLQDADLASNNHGWQWVAGTGTDAAPYHRVFNPVAQGRRFDPDGAYVRRWVPELAGLPAALVHEPWKLDGQASLLDDDTGDTGGTGDVGPPTGYPAPIVDHAVERVEALDRYEAARLGDRGDGDHR